MGQRVRERIPTPENDNRLNNHHHNSNSTTASTVTNPFSGIASIASGVALTAQHLATTPSIFPTSNNVPILGTLLLSPIKESDSVNNTLTSGSMTAKSLLPLNLKSTNTQFSGSLVIPTTSHQDIDGNTTNSFVVLPASSASNETEIIPVSITTMPLTISTHSHSNMSSSMSGAVITELPVDQAPDTPFRGRNDSAPATPRLGNFFSDHSASPILSPALRHKIQRQQSVESNRSASANLDSVSNSSNSTLSKRPGNGKKHSEVYV